MEQKTQKGKNDLWLVQGPGSYREQSKRCYQQARVCKIHLHV